MQTVLSFLIRLIFVAFGLVFAASLAFAFVLMLAIGGARAAWAKLTGRPVAPFVVRIDPRGGFQRMYRRAGQGSRTPWPDAVRSKRGLADVTDVEPKAGGSVEL